MTARGPKVELWQGKGGRFYFHRRNRNGKITAASQGYAHRRTARNAAMRDLPGLPIEWLDSPPK